jgi:hypothetical protein
MSTTTKSRKRVKPERSVSLPTPIRDGLPGSLQITIGKEVHQYDVHPIPSDFGTAFRLIKYELVRQADNTFELQDTARYNVLLNGEQSTCDCPGHTYRGKCKHVDALTTLRQRNLI